MSKTSLERRTENFTRKLHSLGKYSYVSGYKGYKYPVVVAHNACGCTVEVLAESILNPNKADTCKHCTDTIRYSTLKEKEAKIKEIYINLDVIGEDKTKAKKKVYVVRCNTCGRTYRVSYSQLKTKSFSCCVNGKGSLYVRHRDNQVKTILKNMKPNYAFGPQLLDIVKESIEDLSYIKNRTVDKTLFLLDVYNKIIDYYVEKKIDVCLCCGSIKKGSDWGTYTDTFSEKICYSCMQKKKKCNTCLTEKKQNNFEFDYENQVFKEKCKKCE